jgi:serine-type D-Ala-D-Ala carboxypeptidase/endopeptidase (penicillin-binding protein 4)
MRLHSLRWPGLTALAWVAVLAIGPATAAPASMPRPAGPTHDLPAAVETALAHSGVAASSMVAWVEEVGGSDPRLAWQAERPANPASLMKLVTTFAGLDLLGPAFTWSTPVWLQGTIADGVLNGDLVIKGNGDPKLVLERIWLLLRRVRQAGVREIRGDIVVAAPFRPAIRTPPISTASPCGRTTPMPMRCC